MFRFFKRSKIKSWEIQFLKSTMQLLPDAYKRHLIYIEEGLLRGVITDAGDIKNYVAFKYDSAVYKRFEDPLECGFKLSDIKVNDRLSGKWVNVTLYFSHGVLNGYSIDSSEGRKFELNPAEIRVDKVKRISFRQSDFEEIGKFLTLQETERISKDDVCTTLLNGKIYYHLKDLEDGNFIGIDTDNNVYRITHDPFEIVLIEREKLYSLL